MHHIQTARGYLEEASRSLKQARHAPDNYLLDHKTYTLLQKTEATINHFVTRLYKVQRIIFTTRRAHNNTPDILNPTRNTEPNDEKEPSPQKRQSPLQETTDP